MTRDPVWCPDVGRWDVVTPEQLRGHLLRHAVAMGGWLSAEFLEMDDYRAATAALVAEGLLVHVAEGRPPHYVLTAAGRAAAGVVTR